METLRLDMQVSEEVLGVVYRLRGAGHQAFVVGGAVRDGLLGVQPEDFDVTTSARVEEIGRLFHGKAVGNRFGIFLVDGIEIAPFRKDTYDLTGDARDVRFTAARSLAEDVARRDFTVNGLAFDPITRDVLDFVGGVEDLRNGVIRFIGNPAHRIAEDGNRMLRGIRFASRFGFELEGESFQAIKNHAECISEVPGESVRKEMLKMLGAVHSAPALALFNTTGLLGVIFPELEEGREFEQNRHHGEDVLVHNLLASANVTRRDPVLRLALLLHDIGKPRVREQKDGDFTFHQHETVGAELARDVLTRLRFPNTEVERVEHIVRHHMFCLEKDPSAKSVRRFLSNHGDRVNDLLVARIADRRANLAKRDRSHFPAAFRNLVRQIHQVRREGDLPSRKNLAINGNDLISLGMKPGPLFRGILDGALEFVLEDPGRNERELLLRFVQDRFGEGERVVA